MSLNQKVAIVTAASRGIGRAVAERLGKEGASVVVNYLSNQDKADQVVRAIVQADGSALAVRGDVSKRQDVTHLFDEAISHYGQVNLVVNVAGVSVFKPHQQLTDEDFEKVFGVNARGAMYVLQEAANRITDSGRIVQFSTGGTQMAVPAGGIYAASKAAGERFAFALAKELGERQITVNVVSPGVTDTDGLTMPPDAVEQLIAQTPLGRLGQPQEVADVVAFLVSDDARWMTGQNLQANGGIL